MLTNENITAFSGDYRFLSNFWPCEITFHGQKLPSVEHAYVAAKCNILDAEELSKLSQMTSGQVKRYGRKLPIRDDWDDFKFSVMDSLVTRKFTDNLELFKLLLSTGDALLIEGNTWGDRYWGQCPIGNGSNYLGKILMKVRDELSSTPNMKDM